MQPDALPKDLCAAAPPVEPELTGRVALCDSGGRLNRAAVGWSRQPLHDINLRGRWGRNKRWNYWCATDGELLFSVTLSSLDYVGAAFAYLWHRATGTFIEQTVLRPLARGCTLPPGVDTDVQFEDRRLNFRFERDANRTRILVDSSDFAGQTLSAELEIGHPPGHETLNVVIPWSDRTFQFTSKQHCLPAAGTVRWGQHAHSFDPRRAFACLDFGRGIWPYRTTWNWGACSVRTSQGTIGLNLGGQWTDGTGMTENGVVIDGRQYKFGECVRFEHAADLMLPWRVHSVESDRVDLTFRPLFERVARSNMLLVASHVRQMLGHFTGTLRPDGCETIRLDDAFGWVEDHAARW